MAVLTQSMEQCSFLNVQLLTEKNSKVKTFKIENDLKVEIRDLIAKKEFLIKISILLPASITEDSLKIKEVSEKKKKSKRKFSKTGYTLISVVIVKDYFVKNNEPTRFSIIQNWKNESPCSNDEIKKETSYDLNSEGIIYDPKIENNENAYKQGQVKKFEVYSKDNNKKDERNR